MKSRFLFVTLSLLAPALAWAMPTGTVVLRNGARFENVKYEIRGKRVKVTLKYGERTFDMSEIKALRPNRDEGPAGEEAAEEDAAGVDWDTRFRLVPPEGWEAVDVVEPMVRAKMRHTEFDATVSVSVRPAEGAWIEPSVEGKGTKVSKEVSERFFTDISMFYGRAPKPRIEAKKYFETPVYRMNAFLVSDYRAQKNAWRVNSEVRFRRFGLEYAVTYSVKKEDAAAMQHEVEDALAAFSFLPAMSVSESSYSDFERGFAISRPADDWTLTAAPFHRTLPVQIQTAGGRGEIEVRVHENAKAADIMNSMINGRAKGRHFVKRSAGPKEHRGSEVQAFSFEDFKRGGTKKLHYQGFAAQAGANVIVFTGIAPLSDDDSDKIDGEVQQSLASAQVYDPERIRAGMARQRDALTFLSQAYGLALKKKYGEAVQRYDNAIEQDPNFALAYFLRGQANKLKNDFRGYQADLLKAEELAPGNGYGDELADIAKIEAAAAIKRKDWETAVDLLRRIYSSTKSAEDLKRLTNALSQLWNKSKKESDPSDRVEELENKLKSFRKVKEIHGFMAKMYSDACSMLIKAKEYSKARRMAGKLKKLGKSVKNSKYTNDAKRLEEAVKRARSK